MTSDIFEMLKGILAPFDINGFQDKYHRRGDYRDKIIYAKNLVAALEEPENLEHTTKEQYLKVKSTYTRIAVIEYGSLEFLILAGVKIGQHYPATIVDPEKFWLNPKFIK